MKLSVKNPPPCIEHAKTNGPAIDDSLAWCINLGKWFKLSGFDETKAALHVNRLFDSSGSLEELDIDEIGSHIKTGFNSDIELSCKELMGSDSFRQGCTQEKCPYFDRPMVPLDGPTAKRVYLSDPNGSIGVAEDGSVRQVRPGKDDQLFLRWISDCAIFIHTETIANEGREFIFEGTGAVDKQPVRFTMPAEDLADKKKFKAAVINAFGAANRFGELDFDAVQRITVGTIKRRRLCAPTWIDDKPQVPGMASSDIEFKLLSLNPAMVYDGNLDEAKTVLANLLDVPGPIPILVTAILGAPIYAKYFNNDRFGVGMWGKTGSLKTSITKKAMCLYGIGYNEDVNLLKFGRSNSTGVGMQEVLAGAGCLPQIIDNVKAVDPKDAQLYVGIIHSIIEGMDKIRGKKDGGIRDSKLFCCTPIVTGEVKPDEASTSARVLNLKWEEPKDKTQVDYVQRNISKLPVIGYHWLNWLGSVPFRMDGFEEARTSKTDAFNAKNYTNSGRLATIYCLLRKTWDYFLEGPFKDVFESRTERFVSLLDAACEQQGRMVTDETEVERFISGINTILATQPHLIQQGENQMPSEYGNSVFKDVIGRWMRNGDDGADGDLFLVPAPTLNAMKRLSIFTQIPTEGSLTDALDQAGYLAAQKSKRRRVQQTMNGHRVYGWMVRGDLFKLREKEEQEPLLKS